jgi:hypothetical protein
MSSKAGEFAISLMGKQNANTTIASIVAVAKESGIDIGRLLQMVEEAYNRKE